MSASPSLSRDSQARFWLLCFGFVACGIVTVLPGPLLPLLAARWHLPDVQSGGFFTAEFAASTLAAIVSPRRLRFSLPTGYLLMTAGILLLAASARLPHLSQGHLLALAAYAFIGLGIGLSVTATNLTVAAVAASAPRGERARRLSVANIWWGVGAVACPWLVAAAERALRVQLLLFVLAAVTAATFLALLRLPGKAKQPAAPDAATPTTAASQLSVFVFFALLLFLYVGVENSVGGWIATYSHRFGGMSLADASLTVSVYWLALLVGRGAGSVALRRLPERAIWCAGLALSLAAVAVLMQPHARALVLLAVAAAGFGFGPVFPVGVSRMLARVADQRHTGWVFATCASGGAVLPWLTGMVSTRSGSLRTSFAVPVTALAAILLLALAENLLLRRPAAVQQAQTE